jgi:hypothetical protein
MRAAAIAGAATLVTAIAVFASAGQAQTFACAAATAGQLSVQGNVQCECRWFLASRLRSTPAGHRWDCGILRARTNDEVPATANPYPYSLPEALSIERPLILPELQQVPGPPRHPLIPQAG